MLKCAFLKVFVVCFHFQKYMSVPFLPIHAVLCTFFLPICSTLNVNIIAKKLNHKWWYSKQENIIILLVYLSECFRLT